MRGRTQRTTADSYSQSGRAAQLARPERRRPVTNLQRGGGDAGEAGPTGPDPVPEHAGVPSLPGADESAARPASPVAAGRPVAKAAVLIGLGNVTSRVLGLVREQVIAALYGATGATSAFRTATRVSTAAYDLLLSGAVTSALVPVFSDYTAAGKTADLSRIISTFINLTLTGMAVVVGLLALATPLLVSVLGADVEHFDLAVDLTRIALPSILLLGISGILTSVLYARQAFAVPAFGVAVYNAGIIVAALALAGPFSIHGLALGLGVGALLQVLVQLPALRDLRYQPVIDLRHPGVRLVLHLYAPVFLGMIASYAVVIVDTHLAWRTGSDSVAAMGFAGTLIQFPLGLVGAAASLAILPSLARLASSAEPQDQAAFVDLLLRGMKMVILLIVPLAVALIVLRGPVVSLLFERAAFDAVATQRTAVALTGYAPQLPFVVVDQLLIVAFYARKNTVIPVLVGIAGVGMYLAVALALVTPLGMLGLAIANAAQNSVHGLILFILLARLLPPLRSIALAGFVMRIAASGAFSAAVVAAAASVLASSLASPDVLPRVAGLIAAGTLGLTSYAVALVALRVGELSSIVTLLRTRPRRG
ncbi:MAG: murein biosynthesis integral membrane protein MurJ [Chloroflexi bacterium]|nr:murein biosynthesis integral membrane protein MurJ [Chloroflexota bacterium]